MWNDTETKEDLLNFYVIAENVVKSIEELNSEPVSIGISGDWGTGKSSMMAMIQNLLEKKMQNIQNNQTQNGVIPEGYLIVKFNAWLYQGFDDAKSALLQIVAEAIQEKFENDKKFTDKVKDKCIKLLKRINLLNLARLSIPVLARIFTDFCTGGRGTFASAYTFLSSFINNTGSSQNATNTIETTNTLLKSDSNCEEQFSITREISRIREDFHILLKELNVRLVVLIDDLDRCLPDTAISTLEAMRLLLFTPQTVFIIAADENMIQTAVRVHFQTNYLPPNTEINYFDKLIQIPIRVPHLNVDEIRGYISILFAERAYRLEKIISEETYSKGREKTLEILRNSWKTPLTTQVLQESFDEKINDKIDIANQLAPVFSLSTEIGGNPRTIKRFLNELMFRDSIAKQQSIEIGFAELVKLQLLERCNGAVFNTLSQLVAQSLDGRVSILSMWEHHNECNTSSIDENNPNHVALVNFAQSSLGKSWFSLKPELFDIDLRPYIYLSRTQPIVTFNTGLSDQARIILQSILAFKDSTMPPSIKSQLQKISNTDIKGILNELVRKSRADHWDSLLIRKIVNISSSFPSTSAVDICLSMLREIPANFRQPDIIVFLAQSKWANSLLKEWYKDPNTPDNVRKAIQINLNNT